MSADNSLGPPQHSRAFRRRRFFNWFVLGLTYATYYMGRYNVNVVKDHVEKTYLGGSQTEFGIVGLCGFWTYALSELVNGPLADRIGGRRAILLGAVGAGVFNLAIGLFFLSHWATSVIVVMSVLYAANMFFQSFGAMSVVKVNAPWFHLRERGVFGGVFGIMISLGYVFSMDTAGFVMAHTGEDAAHPPLRFLGHAFATPWYFAFMLPTVALAVMFLVSFFVVRDRPGDAGYADFSTADASDGDETPVTFRYLVQKVFTNPIMLTLVAAEFCTGFVRQSLLFFFPKWLANVHHVAPGTSTFYWAVNGITLGGIVGGLGAGWLSDRFFDSRRPPVAFFFYLMQIVTILAMGMIHSDKLAAAMIGVCCAFIFGVHGMLSGTASMDFGGKKGAATAAGMLDGIQYVASGITSVLMGVILDKFGWGAWTWSIVPFSLVGAIIMTRIWNEKPRSRRPADEGPASLDRPSTAASA